MSRHKNCRSPLHICIVCGAWWMHWPEGTWTRLTSFSGTCCDNAPMGSQIQAMDADKVCESVAELARCLDGGVDCAAERVALKSALREAIEYIELDSETPPMLDSWKKLVTPNSGGTES